mgnify:CR=1 FL=1
MNRSVERITAITVTFNRTVTLKKCIAALLTQSRPVDDIIIVDNHSKPEERAILDVIAASDERIHLHVLSDNMGGAGGFEAGMRLAVEKYPADWYWIMDDDAYPRADCLEKLIEARDVLTGKKTESNNFTEQEIKKNGNVNADINQVKSSEVRYSCSENEIGFLAPLIYGVDLKKYQLYHHKKLCGIALVNKPIVNTYKDLERINPVEANAFVGPLISKEAVHKVGIADGSLFIYGDDTEYTYRITRHFSGFMIRDAVIDHQDPPIVGDNYLKPKGWWKEYYSNRNWMLLVNEFTENKCKRICAKLIIGSKMLRFIIAAAIKPKYAGYRILRIKLLAMALNDGLKNRHGKSIDPLEYNKKLDERRNRI